MSELRAAVEALRDEWLDTYYRVAKSLTEDDRVPLAIIGAHANALTEVLATVPAASRPHLEPLPDPVVPDGSWAARGPVVTCRESWADGWGQHHCGLDENHDGVCVCTSGCDSTHRRTT